MGLSKTGKNILVVVFSIIVIGIAIGIAYWEVGQNARTLLDKVIIPNTPKGTFPNKSPTIVAPINFSDT